MSNKPINLTKTIKKEKITIYRIFLSLFSLILLNMIFDSYDLNSLKELFSMEFISKLNAVNHIILLFNLILFILNIMSVLGTVIRFIKINLEIVYLSNKELFSGVGIIHKNKDVMEKNIDNFSLNTYIRDKKIFIIFVILDILLIYYPISLF